MSKRIALYGQYKVQNRISPNDMIILFQYRIAVHTTIAPAQYIQFLLPTFFLSIRHVFLNTVSEHWFEGGRNELCSVICLERGTHIQQRGRIVESLHVSILCEKRKK